MATSLYNECSRITPFNFVSTRKLLLYIITDKQYLLLWIPHEHRIQMQCYKTIACGMKNYVADDSASFSLGDEDPSRFRSPMPLGGPMLHRAVLCSSMASLIF